MDMERWELGKSCPPADALHKISFISALRPLLTRLARRGATLLARVTYLGRVNAHQADAELGPVRVLGPHAVAVHHAGDGSWDDLAGQGGEGEQQE